MNLFRTSAIGSLARRESDTLRVPAICDGVAEALLSVAFMRFTLIYGAVPSFLTDKALFEDMSDFIDHLSDNFGKAGEIRHWVSNDWATSVKLEKAPDKVFHDIFGSYVAHFTHTNSDGATYTVEYLVTVKEGTGLLLEPTNCDIDFIAVY